MKLTPQARRLIEEAERTGVYPRYQGGLASREYRAIDLIAYVPGSHLLTPVRLVRERRMSLMARHSSDPEIRAGSFRIDPAELVALPVLVAAAHGTQGTAGSEL